MSENLFCVPPRRLRHREFHWLVSERSSSPVPAQWIREVWYSFGEDGPITPEEMWRRGWQWGAQADPPRNLR